MKIRYKRIRGTYDILPEEIFLYKLIENTAEEIFKKYQYKELRIPTFETADLFIHTTGETTDIVQKEMYVFEDKKGRKLALRPEGTPGIVRAYLENQLYLKYPVSKFCYFGQMFRYERPQEGRYREFFQIGAEYFGNAHPVADAEVIFILKEILNSVGLKNIIINLNSLGCTNCRPRYRHALVEFLAAFKQDLCEDCNIRIEKNPLRVLDCKIDRTKLTKFNVPTIDKFLCAECLNHFTQLKVLLKNANINYNFDPLLVRGLDYYTRTVFEISLPKSDVIVAGGRYDNLIAQLSNGARNVPAVGFAIGTDRVVEGIQQTIDYRYKTLDSKHLTEDILPVFVAVQPIDEAIQEAFKLVMKLNSEKRKNIVATGPYPDRSLKSQMRLANSINSKYVIIIGENELKNNYCILRNMTEKSQQEIKLSEVIEKLTE